MEDLEEGSVFEEANLRNQLNVIRLEYLSSKWGTSSCGGVSRNLAIARSESSMLARDSAENVGPAASFASFTL